MRLAATLTAVYTLAAAALTGPVPVHAAQSRGVPATRAAVPASAPALSAADQAFLEARDAARLGNRARLAQLAPQLASHPLVAYVEYWQLAPQLRTDPSASTEVAAFYARHADTYIADRLRLDWALALRAAGTSPASSARPPNSSGIPTTASCAATRHCQGTATPADRRPKCSPAMRASCWPTRATPRAKAASR